MVRRSEVYERCKAEWDRRRNDPDRGSGNWLISRPEVIDAAKVVKTMRLLHALTNDPRYSDLRNHLVTDLIDPKTGNWSGHQSWHPDTVMACGAIEQTIATGVHEREAIAEFVAEFNIDATSFSAACKRVKRLMDEYRKRERRS